MASRVDERTGVREEALFLGNEDDRAYACFYLPPSEPIGAVVVCTSIYAELMVNYRKEVLLARSLAEAGMAVARFHYRSTGNSDGDAAATSFDTFRDDARRVSAALAERVGIESTGFFGTRFGALIAASAASDSAGAPVAFWDPILKANDFFREALRARAIRGVKQQKEEERKVSFEELADDEWTDMLGYRVYGRFYKSSVSRSLAEEIGEARPVFFLQFSRTDSLSPKYAGFAESLRAAGCDVTTHSIVGQPAWWFIGERLRADEDVRTTTDWFASVYGRKR